MQALKTDNVFRDRKISSGWSFCFAIFHIYYEVREMKKVKEKGDMLRMIACFWQLSFLPWLLFGEWSVWYLVYGNFYGTSKDLFGYTYVQGLAALPYSLQWIGLTFIMLAGTILAVVGVIQVGIYIYVFCKTKEKVWHMGISKKKIIKSYIAMSIVFLVIFCLWSF